MLIREALIKANTMLKNEKLEDLDIKIKYIMMDVMSYTTTELILKMFDNMDKEKEEEFFKKIEELKKQIPVAYVIKKAHFLGLELDVDDTVLIPRQDSEILVMEIVKEIKEKLNSKDLVELLDIGTGSGCLDLAIINEFYKAKYVDKTIAEDKKIIIYSVDISDDALRIARKNKEKLFNEFYKKYNIKKEEIKMYNIIYSDIFKNVNRKFDIIYSNPPYIKSKDIEDLDEEVKKEPRLALDGKEDGLYYYREILKSAKYYLKSSGTIFFEIGSTQKEDIREECRKKGFLGFRCIKDLENRDRVLRVRASM